MSQGVAAIILVVITVIDSGAIVRVGVVIVVAVHSTFADEVVMAA